MNKKEQFVKYLIDCQNDLSWSNYISLDFISSIDSIFNHDYEVKDIYRCNIINGLYKIYFIETTKIEKPYILIMQDDGYSNTICNFINCNEELSESLKTELLETIKISILKNENDFFDRLINMVTTEATF